MDYFFDAVDARAQLAASRVTIENLIKCLTEMKDNAIFRNASVQCAEDQLNEINELLEKKIGE